MNADTSVALVIVAILLLSFGVGAWTYTTVAP